MGEGTDRVHRVRAVLGAASAPYVQGRPKWAPAPLQGPLSAPDERRTCPLDPSRSWRRQPRRRRRPRSVPVAVVRCVELGEPPRSVPPRRLAVPLSPAAGHAAALCKGRRVCRRFVICQVSSLGIEPVASGLPRLNLRHTQSDMDAALHHHRRECRPRKAATQTMLARAAPALESLSGR